MITRIELTDFMAHVRSAIELGPGVTVLVGPNNSGKSAVVEALRCLATNPAPRHCIRHGAREARVEATLEDGTRVAWVRRKGYALYEILRPGEGTPEVYAKFGRHPPQDVLDALRLDLVPVETGGEIDVHLGNQREPVFLLNQPPSAAAAFFAASSESTHLLAMQNALKRRVLEAKRDEAGLVARQARLEEELDRLAPLPDINLRLESAREAEAGLARLAAQLPGLESAIGRRRELAGRVRTASLRGERLATLAPPPRTFDAVSLAGLLAGLARSRGERERAAARARLLARLAPKPPVFPAAGLAALLAGLAGLAARRDTARASAQRLAGLTPPPVLFDERPLAGVLAGLSGLAAQRKRAGDLLAERGRAEAEGAARITARLTEIKACPLCGAAISPEAFLAGPSGRGGCGHDA